MDKADLLALILAIPPFVMAFTLHEFAHAWTADRLGDDTPRRMGRVTLDPMAHLDPLGSIMFIMSQIAGYGVGWAKPVPFNARNLRNPRRDTVLIALAGPVSNLLQFLVFLFSLWLFHLLVVHDTLPLGRHPQLQTGMEFFEYMLIEGVLVNILLAAFNMIPLPPLDGHYILAGIAPPFVEEFYNSIRPYAGVLFLVLVMWPGDSNPLNSLLEPCERFAYRSVFLALGGPSL